VPPARRGAAARLLTAARLRLVRAPPALPAMEPHRQSILVRSPRAASAHNVESSHAQYDAEQARLAVKSARLSRYEAALFPTAQEDTARKQELYQHMLAQQARRKLQPCRARLAR
jgi:hypothetical protein